MLESQHPRGRLGRQPDLLGEPGREVAPAPAHLGGQVGDRGPPVRAAQLAQRPGHRRVRQPPVVGPPQQQVVEQVEARRPAWRRREPVGQRGEQRQAAEVDRLVGQLAHRQPEQPVGAERGEVDLHPALAPDELGVAERVAHADQEQRVDVRVVPAHPQRDGVAEAHDQVHAQARGLAPAQRQDAVLGVAEVVQHQPGQRRVRHSDRHRPAGVRPAAAVDVHGAGRTGHCGQRLTCSLA